MKVLCIQSCKGPKSPRGGGIKDGNIYEILNSENDPKHGLIYLIFREDTDYWYTAKHFIPLSDKDETEYADEVLTRLFQPVKF